MTLNYNLGVNGSLTVNGTGTLTATTQTISVGGNWAVNTGSFTAGTGTVIFANAALPTTISGASTFYGLTIATPGKTVNFGGTTTTIASWRAPYRHRASGKAWLNLTGTGWTLTWAGAVNGADVNFASIDHIAVFAVLLANSSINGGNNNDYEHPGYECRMVFPIGGGNIHLERLDEHHLG